LGDERRNKAIAPYALWYTAHLRLCVMLCPCATRSAS